MNKGKVQLKGKIAVENDSSYVRLIHMGSGQTNSFKLRYDDIKYNQLIWLNAEDNFLGTETVQGPTRGDYRSNLVKFDPFGKLLDTIYQAKPGEIIWSKYPSWDDKYLLFTTRQLTDPKLHPFEALTPMLTLHIMNLAEKEVIETIDSIGRSPNYQIHESPWLHEGKRFVYSISTVANLSHEGEIVNPTIQASGIYIYDFDGRVSNLLIAGGSYAVVSPTRDQMAYVANDSIGILDLETKENRIIHTLGMNRKVLSVHFTPDGENIYLAYFTFASIGNSYKSEEKLISVSTGKERVFKKLMHGFGQYTWK